MYIVNDTPEKVKWENERSSMRIFGHMDEKSRTASPVNRESRPAYSILLEEKSAYFSIS